MGPSRIQKPLYNVKEFCRGGNRWISAHSQNELQSHITRSYVSQIIKSQLSNVMDDLKLAVQRIHHHWMSCMAKPLFDSICSARGESGKID